MIQRNERISYVLGVEELILLNWPYYPKQYTNIMQSLSNYPWHFPQNFRKKFHRILEQIILKLIWKQKKGPELYTDGK